ncbi:MAG: IS3 family transposase [Actinomycetota bacterium]
MPLARRRNPLELARPTFYYRSQPLKERDLEMMRHMGEIHLKYPFYGSRRIMHELRGRGYKVGRGHVSRLMRIMGIHVIWSRPRTAIPDAKHKVYPYLPRGPSVGRANHVWAADICSLPMRRGCAYLAAVLDWAGRKALSWRLSNALDTSFRSEAPEEATSRHGAPEIFDTEKGSRFTSDGFTGVLKAHDIRTSGDGRGRFLDNVFVERLWRSVKHEEVYLKAYGSLIEARRGLGAYFESCDARRRHQGLGHKTPDEVYWDPLPKEEAAA